MKQRQNKMKIFESSFFVKKIVIFFYLVEIHESGRKLKLKCYILREKILHKHSTRINIF